MRETYPPVRGSVEALIKLQLQVAKGEFDAAQSRFVTVEMISIAVIVIGVFLCRPDRPLADSCDFPSAE